MSQPVRLLMTLNSLLRTLLALTVVGLLSAGSWIGYRAYHADDLALEAKERALADAQRQLAEQERRLAEQARTLQQQQAQIGQLRDDVAAKELRIARLDTALHLLKVDHRLAELTVVEQGVDPETREPYSSIRFVELDDRGQPIDAPRTFRLRGNVVYIDYWVVKFEDKYVEQSDLDRATSLCLFRRIFGEYQEPNDGYVLDRVGSRPPAYARGRQMSQFEQRIWSDFWEIANDPEQARAKGIRAAHGEAVSTQLRAGRKYRLLLRASGGLSITPATDDVPPPPGGDAS